MEEIRVHTVCKIVLGVVSDRMSDVSMAQQGSAEAVGAIAGDVVVSETHYCHVHGRRCLG